MSRRESERPRAPECQAARDGNAAARGLGLSEQRIADSAASCCGGTIGSFALPVVHSFSSRFASAGQAYLQLPVLFDRTPGDTPNECPYWPAAGEPTAGNGCPG